MREEFDLVHESIRANSDETRNAITAQLAQNRRDMLREFHAAEERDRQAADPSYIPPLSASGTVRLDTPAITISAHAELGPLPPRRERVRQRLIYICKWVWGTHDAPSAKRRKS